jgi:hypothetical protein
MITVLALGSAAFVLVNAVSGIVIKILDHRPTVNEMREACNDAEDSR